MQALKFFVGYFFLSNYCYHLWNLSKLKILETNENNVLKTLKIRIFFEKKSSQKISKVIIQREQNAV